jgi:hypothetical protein
MSATYTVKSVEKDESGVTFVCISSDTKYYMVKMSKFGTEVQVPKKDGAFGMRMQPTQKYPVAILDIAKAAA